LIESERQITRRRPFIHVVTAPVFPPDVESRGLELLELAVWAKRESTFDRFSVPEWRSDISSIVRESALVDRHREAFQETFNCRFVGLCELEIHRYQQGCGIGFHTDAAAPEVRWVINLGRSWNSAHPVNADTRYI